MHELSMKEEGKMKKKMKKKMKTAALTAAVALSFCGFTAPEAAAEISGANNVVIKEGIFDNGEGKSWEETGRTFDKAGSIETGVLRAEHGGYLLFINTESVLVTGEATVTGARNSTQETFIEFQSTPAQICGDAAIKNGRLMVGRYRGALERTGETTIIKGNVYLAGSDLETLEAGEWVMTGSLNVDGQNTRLIIEGDLYCSGTCFLEVTRGGVIEVRGNVMPSADTTFIVDGETREAAGSAGFTLVSPVEDPLKEYVSKGAGEWLA